MKCTAFAFALIGALTLPATPASAQFGGLTKGINKAKEVKDKADKFADLMKMSEKDERALGEQVSEKLRQDFGVFQNADVAKYVTLVGRVLAEGSTRPGLDWQFIVLDTDGVNAFAAPGGLVHITRGALGLVKNEGELAGVLGHEITHVTEKHTVNSIQKSKRVKATTEAGSSGGLAQSLISRLAEIGYTDIINNTFDRSDELEADRVGVALANKAGYAPGALGDVLARIAQRNKDQKEPNGMFATHPLIKDRIANIAKVIKDQKLTATATVNARYAKVITFDAKPLGEVAVIEGTRGLTGGSEKAETKKEEPKKEEPKKKGGLLGKVGLTGGTQSQNTQTVASAGARGGVPDRDATGGSNPKKLSTPVTAAEIDAFKKGIA